MFAVGVAGCSGSNSVSKTLGMSKDVPDERVVRTHQALSVPPDLTLRPPPDSTKRTGTPNPYAQQATSSVQSSGLNNPPSGTTYAQPEPDYNQTASANSSQPQSLEPANTQAAANQPATPPVAANDVYAKYGISKTNPDGSRKSEAQLIKELRQKYNEAKQVENPNYGSVFNIGNLFD